MDSLFDDPAFAAALQQLDLPPYNPGPGEFGHLRTLEEWAEDEGLILSPPDTSFGAPALIGARRASNVATYLALMFVGAGAAAVVFHDRVLRMIGAY